MVLNTLLLYMPWLIFFSHLLKEYQLKGQKSFSRQSQVKNSKLNNDSGVLVKTVSGLEGRSVFEKHLG
jgi:hypothetical protein